MRKGKPGNIVQLAANEKGRFLDWHNGSKGGGRGTMGKFPAKTMTDKTLSPASQAVLDAALPVYDDEHLYVATGEQHAGMIAAAALRAAIGPLVYQLDDEMMRTVLVVDADDLLAIAAELEVVK